MRLTDIEHKQLTCRNIQIYLDTYTDNIYFQRYINNQLYI